MPRRGRRHRESGHRGRSASGVASSQPVAPSASVAADEVASDLASSSHDPSVPPAATPAYNSLSSLVLGGEDGSQNDVLDDAVAVDADDPSLALGDGDGTRLFRIRDAALKGVQSLAGRHQYVWFDKFVEHHELTSREHIGLWWRVLMNSAECRKRLRDNQVPMWGSAHIMQCFCNDCVQQEQAPEEAAERISQPGVALVMVYPSYGYEPRPQTPKSQQHIERTMHNYLTHIGKLPEPLSRCSPDADSKAFAAALAPRRPWAALLPRFIGQEDALRAVQYYATSLADGLLVVVLRGHGRGGGELIMSDGKALKPSDLLARLNRVGFTGTLLCIFNMCQADARPEQLSMEWDMAKFKWATLHSCDGDEMQKPEHGEKVTKLLVKLLHAVVQPDRPALDQVLVDRLWEQLRCEQSAGNATASWRAAPNLRRRRDFDGRL